MDAAGDQAAGRTSIFGQSFELDDITSGFGFGGTHIFVRSTDNAMFTIDCELDDTVVEIKRKVAEMRGCSSYQVRLIFAGKQLRDGSTLRECKVHHKSILTMIQRSAAAETVEGQEAMDAAPPEPPSEPRRKPSFLQVAAESVMLNGLFAKPQVVVRELSGGAEYTVELESMTDTASQLKHHLAEEHMAGSGVTVDQMRLVFAGRQLKDMSTLAEGGVQSGAVLQLVVRGDAAKTLEVDDLDAAIKAEEALRKKKEEEANVVERLQQSLARATENDEAKEARWRAEEARAREAARTPEENRHMAIVRLLFDTLSEARAARDPSLLDPLAALFADDAVLANANLCGTAFAFAEPAVGGRGVVAHLKEFWFGQWDVQMTGVLCCDVAVMGQTVLFKHRVAEWKVRRTGRSVRNGEAGDGAAPEPMVETNAVHFTSDGVDPKIQQWLYFVDATKRDLFIHAFGRKKKKPAAAAAHAAP